MSRRIALQRTAIVGSGALYCGYTRANCLALKHYCPEIDTRRSAKLSAAPEGKSPFVMLRTRQSGSAISSILGARAPGEWQTRFAPAPTGWLHLGHAVNAVFVWGLARALGGRVTLRVEDHDRGRSRPEYVAGIFEDLDWLGLAPDAPYARQSERPDVYARAMERIGNVYACVCSRRDISESTGATNTEVRYPGTCRDRSIPLSETPARRVRIEAGAEPFDDVALGVQTQEPFEQCGDVLIRDRAGNWTYQFAVVADDIDQGVDVVIRGEDLLASTGRQIRLARMLGRARPPVFLHHPLIVRHDGSKLSKSDGATGLRDLRAAGWSAPRVLGEAARLAGLQETAKTIDAPDLAGLFQPAD